MLASVVFIPSAPLLVPELAGPAALDAEPVRAATVAAGAALADRARHWIAVGGADQSRTTPSRDRHRGGQISTDGSFAAYGVDIPVSLIADTASASDVHLSSPTSPLPMPLSMLVAAWLRQLSGAQSVEPWLVPADASVEECTEMGRRLAARVARASEPTGILAVADGSICLSARAPGGGLSREAVLLQKRIDQALGGCDRPVIAELAAAECAEARVGGRAVWQTIAAAWPEQPMSGESSYADAPFGVGYSVATWTPREDSVGAR